MQHCCFEIDCNHNDSYEITMNDNQVRRHKKRKFRFPAMENLSQH